MTSWNALQLLLALVGVAISVLRLRVLWFEADFDVDAFLDAFETALADGELELARRCTRACLPAWPARLALDALARKGEPRFRDRLELDLAEASSRAFRGRDALVTLGRMAGPIALIGVILELGSALHEQGLVALQRGLSVRLAIDRSLLTFAIGLATTLGCFASAASIARSARRVHRGLQRVAAAIERHAPDGRDM